MKNNLIAFLLFLTAFASHAQQVPIPPGAPYGPEVGPDSSRSRFNRRIKLFMLDDRILRAKPRSGNSFQAGFKAATKAEALAGIDTVKGMTPKRTLDLLKKIVGQTYYVSNQGSDTNDGLSPETPFQTVAKVNSLTLTPGTKVLFNANSTFAGSLELYEANGQGTAAKPIVFDSYGGGKATFLCTDAFGVYFENSDYLTFQNLIFRGAGTVSGGGIAGYGSANDIIGLKVRNVEVYDFPTYFGVGIYGFDGTTAGLKNALFENCIVAGCRDGIFIEGNQRAANGTNANTNLVIRRCLTYNNRGVTSTTTNTTGSGIVIAKCDNALIEYCEAFGNGAQNGRTTGGPFGIWMYECTNSKISYCESHHNFSNAYAGDGGGFDIDGGCRNSVIEYCYSHDNDGPGILMFQYAGASDFDNNIARYNISENDARANSTAAIQIGSAGTATGPIIHNNTVYVSLKNLRSGTPSCFSGANNTKNEFRNNIFIADGTGTAIKKGTTTETYSNNYYRTLNSATANFSTGGVTTDPGLQGTLGSAGTVGVFATGTMQGFLDAYKLKNTSTAINAGFTYAAPTVDFYSNVAPKGTRDIGAHEF